MKENLKSYMHKDYFKNQIVEMHCVEYFIMLIIIKKLTQQFLKSCVVFFIAIIQF